MPGLKKLVIGGIATLVVCSAGLGATAISGNGKSKQRSDPVEGSPIDLVDDSLTLNDGSLTLRAHTQNPIDLATLETAGGGSVCLRFTGGTNRSSSLCVSRIDGNWSLLLGSNQIRGTVKLPRPNELEVTTSAKDIRLTPGKLSWIVTTTAANCRPVTGQPPCTDRAPDAGAYTDHLLIAGCQATGTAQLRNGPRGNRIALTYDDGPSTYTNPLLRTLAKLHVPATFFVIGKQVHGRAATLRRELAVGDEIGNHSWSHPALAAGGPRATQELTSTQAAIRNATGYTPCVFRPPYGSTGPDLVSRVRELRMTSILWSVDPTDWKRPGSAAIVNRVVQATARGAIILLHDGGGDRSQTLAATPQIVRQLHARGYRFVTIADLLGYEPMLVMR